MFYMIGKEKNLIGENVKRHRLFKGWEQEDLARETNLSPSVISKLERGIENIEIDNLIKICKELGITLEELLIKDSNLLSLRFVISEHNITTLKEVVKIIKDLYEESK